MLRITNKKIAGLEPIWAAFPGFSLLFTNPGCNSTNSGIEKIKCAPVLGGSMDLYARLLGALEDGAWEALVGKYQFCPLSPDSYHVTVWDGINLSNLDLLNVALRKEWEIFLAGLPDSLKEPPQSMRVVSRSKLFNWSKPISFIFKNLSVINNQALIAELAPAGEDSTARLTELVLSRNDLNEVAGQAFGIKFSSSYHPHVSLGYFANESDGAAAQTLLEGWNAHFLERTIGSVITFDSVGLYGFTDMIRFYRCPDASRD